MAEIDDVTRRGQQGIREYAARRLLRGKYCQEFVDYSGFDTATLSIKYSEEVKVQL